MFTNYDFLNLNTTSDDSNRQCELSEMSTNTSWKEELAELRSSDVSQRPTKKLPTKTPTVLKNFNPTGLNTTSNDSNRRDESSMTKKKRPTSLKDCINPKCAHKMGCKALQCKKCGTKCPYKSKKSTKPQSVNKGYGNGKLQCSTCFDWWGTRKLYCDCSAVNVWDKKKSPTTKSPTTKRKRTNSLDLLFTEFDAGFDAEFDAEFGAEQPVINFQEDAIWDQNKRSRLDSFEIMSTDELMNLL